MDVSEVWMGKETTRVGLIFIHAWFGWESFSLSKFVGGRYGDMGIWERQRDDDDHDSAAFPIQ